jgi:hypothetical protein
MPPPNDWRELVQSIADGEAILVLGPDAVPFYNGEAEASFGELTRQAIVAQLPEGVNHYYARDHLFQFKDAAAKQRAMKCVREVARSQTWLPDSELLQQIVAMPFPVVINLSPDRHLFDAFTSFWRKPQFDYFTTKDKPEPAGLSYPTAYDNPLLFHLAGSVLDKRDSVVLDYHDLFDLLKNMLSDIGVSEHLSRKLQEADRFILLGFELERWYFQLFLHYINRLDSNPFNNYNQNFPILCDISDDSREFIVRQFNIEHHSLSRNDFNEMYEACAQAGILRKLIDPLSAAASAIRGLIIQNRFEEAFAALEAQLDRSMSELDLALLRSRYTRYLEEKNQGIKDEKELALELNKIRYALLTFVNQIGRT